jgi:hypothetical protein
VGPRVCKPPTFNPFNLIPHLQAERPALRRFLFPRSSLLCDLSALCVLRVIPLPAFVFLLSENSKLITDH